MMLTNEELLADWQIGDGVRSLLAFYPPEASNSNVSIVITSLGADFTKLESFGKVDAFSENLVSGLDRSWQRPPGVKAKLRDSKASKVPGMLFIASTRPFSQSHRVCVLVNEIAQVLLMLRSLPVDTWTMGVPYESPLILFIDELDYCD
uniref:PsbP domain-containing protein 3, chloroplastic n=1 Tax=Solanum tuberosum TaxID=4113 RepID=M1BYV0_SOLTU